jgi:hypothetical protein
MFRCRSVYSLAMACALSQWALISYVTQKSPRFFCRTNGGGSRSSPGVRSAAMISIASTWRQGVSYPIPTVVCRISPCCVASAL